MGCFMKSKVIVNINLANAECPLHKGESFLHCQFCKIDEEIKQIRNKTQRKQHDHNTKKYI